MKKAWLINTVLTLILPWSQAQVAEMNWELDREILMKMANDSNYTYDISSVFHITDTKQTDFTTEFIFYPVNPGDDFVSTLPELVNEQQDYKTLWSALHAKLGGGWIHFINCFAYALESQSLNLEEPIMKRPESKWKPKPVTDTWKRTHKWDYYIPLSQKNAQKEYKLRLKNNELGDLKNLPSSYIDLFNETSDRTYHKLKEAGEYKQTAKIDLVKIMLGANYLGKDQINYLSNAVLSAVQNYSSSKLPSVLVFDQFDAAAAMTLTAEGYSLESIVFRTAANLSEQEMAERRKEIEKILATINNYNQEAFKKRLGTYYKN